MAYLLHKLTHPPHTYIHFHCRGDILDEQEKAYLGLDTGKEQEAEDEIKYDDDF